VTDQNAPCQQKPKMMLVFLSYRSMPPIPVPQPMLPGYSGKSSEFTLNAALHCGVFPKVA